MTDRHYPPDWINQLEQELSLFCGVTVESTLRPSTAELIALLRQAKATGRLMLQIAPLLREDHQPLYEEAQKRAVALNDAMVDFRRKTLRGT